MPDKNSLIPTMLSLPRVLGCLYRHLRDWEVAFDKAVDQRAALLARNTEGLTPDQVARLDSVHQGKMTVGDLHDNQLTRKALVVCLGKARIQICKEQKREPSIVKIWRLVERALSEAFRVTFEELDGWEPEFEDRLGDYCAAVVQGVPQEPNAFSTEIARLDAEHFADQLAQDIWNHCSGSLRAHLRTCIKSADGQSHHEQWVSATKAATIANRLTKVNRDWASYWGRFCDKHGVATRAATKKDGSPARGRREVEIGSLCRAILRHSGDFEKATPESEKRRQEMTKRLRDEYDASDEIKQDITEGR